MWGGSARVQGARWNGCMLRRLALTILGFNKADMVEFDTPLFKILAHNDTGQAVGHQGGIVIPKDLEPWFPQLSRRVTPIAPTQEEFVIADLFEGGQFLSSVQTRYQYQTWGGTRSPERRLTGNLGSLRNIAHAGDLFLIERGITDDKHYRFTLLRQGTAQHNQASVGLEGRRWGPLLREMPPVRESEVDTAVAKITEFESKIFELFEANAGVTETRSVRVARSRAFQTHVAKLYQRRCAMCGEGLCHPSGRSETESAHIVPRRLSGSDDARNGLQLCRSHHWAFDCGLIGIGQRYEMTIPPSVLAVLQNRSLAGLNGKPIALPTDGTLAPHRSALAWHSTHILLQN